MLTRLKIKGFKNLVDVEVRLGPITCIAGPNGVGKSNLFDAIHFLSLLADKPFVEAATEVRGGAQLRELFTVGGMGRIELECDVIIPRAGTDDFGQPAEASYTYLTYELALRLEEPDDPTGISRIRLEHEQLSYITKSAATVRLGFKTSPAWRESIVHVSARRTTFISTKDGHIRLQVDRMQDETKDKRGGGKPLEFLSERLPRTVLSSAQNAEEHRTAVLLRQEMRRWRQLQLEPSALRQADDFQSPQAISPSGAHVAATLYRLATSHSLDVYTEAANRLAELVDGVGSIRVERDEGRRLFRMMMKDLNGVELPASSLSDGTLRFIALAVMELDPEATGVVCLEEPENGIHPQRVAAMLRLLMDVAVDPLEPIDEGNPLRQVLLSTHSPLVVVNAAADDVVFAAPRVHRLGDQVVRGLVFRGIEGTWRAAEDDPGTSIGAVLGYLGGREENESPAVARPRRVKDLLQQRQPNPTVQISLPIVES
ncbi:MAG: AAA family ATPase [Myxococcales bacterium]|nr:AAA family ATPase [Myxococcales bacterium]